MLSSITIFDTSQPEQWIEKGIQYQNNKNYKDSIYFLKQAYDRYKSLISHLKERANGNKTQQVQCKQSLFSDPIEQYEKKIAKITFYLGLDYSSLSQHKTAIIYFDEALSIALKCNDHQLIGLANLHLGISLSQLENYNGAIQKLTTAQTGFQEHAQDNSISSYYIALCMYYLGQVYNLDNQHEEAISYLNNAKNFFTNKSDDLEKFIDCILEIGIAHLKMKHYGQAITALDRLKRMDLTIEKQADTNQLIGVCYLKSNKPLIAIQYFQKALKKYNEQNNQQNIAITNAALGICHALAEKFDMAKPCLKTALVFLSQSASDNRILFSTHDLLCELISPDFISLAETSAISEIQTFTNLYKKMKIDDESLSQASTIKKLSP